MGRFLTMCTLLADVLGLVASYLAGAIFFPALGSILPGWLSWLRDLCVHLYQAPLLWMSLIPQVPRAPAGLHPSSRPHLGPGVPLRAPLVPGPASLPALSRNGPGQTAAREPWGTALGNRAAALR